jgi:hydrogenase maturation protease
LTVGPWEEIEQAAPEAIEVGGLEVRTGSRVLLAPRPGADVMDLALAGRTAIVEEIVQNVEGDVHLAVIVEDDPGRDLGESRQPGHRFFFAPDEVEPLEDAPATGTTEMRILVAGIGNVFLGDDGFGVELAARLAKREWPEGVEVVDFGIRGMDLAFALQQGYDAAVLLDATPRGQEPGTLYVIEPKVGEEEAALDTHGMDPVKVLGLVRAMGATPPRLLVVGCEPETRLSSESEELLVELSEPVEAALDEAASVVDSVIGELRGEGKRSEGKREDGGG